jgi:hydroxymethylbilane synthase
VRDRLAALAPELAFELRVIKTQGDKILDTPLAQIGGKGLFVKEIEDALRTGEADLAVHSMKDVPAELPAGLTIAAVPEREDPRDALCARQGTTLDDLAPGAVVGTSSLRRTCQLRAHRPDLHVEILRGNVDTRLRRLDEGSFDAIVLAAAGLARLGRRQRATSLLDPSLCLPAIGQGALGIEVRAGDPVAEPLCAQLSHAPTARAVAAERAFLAHLGAGCQTPVAGYAVATGDRLTLQVLCGRPDGTGILREQGEGPLATAEALGHELGDRLLARGADRILAELENPGVVGGG